MPYPCMFVLLVSHNLPLSWWVEVPYPYMITSRNIAKPRAPAP